MRMRCVHGVCTCVHEVCMCVLPTYVEHMKYVCVIVC